jgi:nucleotide-binding universal stress UspA family protein
MDNATVVVGVDGSEPSHRALEWAADEARHRSGVLRIVHVFPAHPPFGFGEDPEIRSSARGMLEEAADRARSLLRGAAEVQAELVEGRSARVLVDESRRAALVVVSNRGHGGFSELLLGATAVRVAEHAACPVVVVPRNEGVDGAARQVVVGVDPAARSTGDLEFAFSRAASRGTGLVALHAWHLPTAYGAYAGARLLTTDVGKAGRDAHERLETALAPWRRRFPRVDVDLRVVQAHPVSALAEASAHDADVVVVGSRGESALAGAILGSVSQEVLRHVRCPVVVAR